MTLIDLARLYVASRILSATYAAEIIRTAKRFEAATGIHDLSAIDPEAAARFLVWLIRHSGNANTQWHYIARLKILLVYAKELKLISELPPLPRITRPHKIPRAWTREQFKRLYDHANLLPGRVGVQLARIWWPSLIAAAYHTASRIGALLSARWEDFTPERRVLILRAESQKTKRDQVYLLPDYLVAKIEAMRWPQRDLIWEWPHCRRYFFTRFRKILRETDLEPQAGRRFALFHQIRRTAATIAAKDSGIAAAQTLLGHASARTTLEHYIDPTIMRGAIELPSLE